MEKISRTMARAIAGSELSLLLTANALPEKPFNGARVGSKTTDIYDVNGELLFYRIPLYKGYVRIASVDIAADPSLKNPLLSINVSEYNVDGEMNKAIVHYNRTNKVIDYDKVRMVSYSYPKLAVQFLKRNNEVKMLELGTLIPVPPSNAVKEEEKVPSHFARWSLLDTILPEFKKEYVMQFHRHVEEMRKVAKDIDWEKLAEAHFYVHRYEELLEPRPICRRTLKELHYSPQDSDHSVCYELRGQMTNVWCVAASVQMILDFYRYNYEQTRIAGELHLGTLTDPNGLPYSRDGDVVKVLEELTNNALSATMNMSPTFQEFVDEINMNRPLISFIPGHSRTVAGYVLTTCFRWFTFRGLMVYDPWPPCTGVITRWENFDANSYRVTFASKLTLA